MTPHHLAVQLAARVRPSGKILEPCAGNGNFVRALRPYGDVRWCEIDLGVDFFQWTEPVDWIVTNPPWSQFANFLKHSLTIADHVALMSTVNHWWTGYRVRLIREGGFRYQHLILFDPPDSFPATGFQLGMMVVSKQHVGDLCIETLETSEGDSPQGLLSLNGSLGEKDDAV